MGNTLANLRAAGRAGAKRRLPTAPTTSEQEAMNKIAAQEQQRLRELPSMEEMGRKDEPLDQLLTRISGAIKPRTVRPGMSPDQANSDNQGASRIAPKGLGEGQGITGQAIPGGRGGTALSMSAKDRLPIPEYRPSGLSQEQLQQLQGKSQTKQITPDDNEPGRIQAFAIREVMEAKNKAEAEGKPLDMGPWVDSYGADAAKLEQLFQHCAIPYVGRFKTFGHEYAYARPPPWWLPKSTKGAIYKSEAAVLESSKTSDQTAFIPPQLRRKEAQASTQESISQIHEPDSRKVPA